MRRWSGLALAMLAFVPLAIGCGGSEGVTQTDPVPERVLRLQEELENGGIEISEFYGLGERPHPRPKSIRDLVPERPRGLCADWRAPGYAAARLTRTSRSRTLAASPESIARPASTTPSASDSTRPAT